MHTPASVGNHPIHPMLVVFPIGLFVFSLVCDIIGLRSADATFWSAAALYTMIGGFIGALAAAVPGLIDLLSIKDQQTKKIGLTHMAINLTVVVLYAVNIWLRVGGAASRTPLVLSVIAVAMLVVSGWLGGKMVYERAVGVNGESTMMPDRR